MKKKLFTKMPITLRDTDWESKQRVYKMWNNVQSLDDHRCLEESILN
jgi:hypothetical protein